MSCSCAVLTREKVLAAAERLAAADPARPVTPGRIFRALGAKPQCGACFSLIRHEIAAAGVAFTCPEPLATVAEEETVTIEMVEIEMTFDVTDKVA